jgi:hypothetical protein
MLLVLKRQQLLGQEHFHLLVLELLLVLVLP